jgi:Flp pilus assembly protein TadG
MMRSFTRSDRGTSLIEFALVAPVLIFLVIGLIEVGRYTYLGMLVAHAARAGVQYGAQNAISAADSTGMSNATLHDAPNITISVTPTAFCSENGAVVSCTGPSVTYYVQVTASGTFTSLLNYPGIPNRMPISSTVTMRVTNQ